MNVGQKLLTIMSEAGLSEAPPFMSEEPNSIAFILA